MPIISQILCIFLDWKNTIFEKFTIFMVLSEYKFHKNYNIFKIWCRSVNPDVSCMSDIVVFSFQKTLRSKIFSALTPFKNKTQTPDWPYKNTNLRSLTEKKYSWPFLKKCWSYQNMKKHSCIFFTSFFTLLLWYILQIIFQELCSLWRSRKLVKYTKLTNHVSFAKDRNSCAFQKNT